MGHFVRKYSDSERERIKAMWLAGETAAYIAQHFNGMTRNMAIGVVSRMNLPKRPAPPRKPLPPPKPKPIIVAPIVNAPEPLLIDGERVNLMLLDRGMCKWPVSHMSEPEVFFCGNPQGEKGPYCSAHRRIGIQPQTGKSRVDPDMRRKSGIDRAFS